MATKAITNDTFDEIVKNSPLPVFVDFWAPWCAPCRALGPTIEEISDEMADSMVVYKCNVDEEGDLAARFGIASIPTMMLFKGDVTKPELSMVSNHPKEDIVAAVKQYL